MASRTHIAWLSQPSGAPCCDAGTGLHDAVLNEQILRVLSHALKLLSQCGSTLHVCAALIMWHVKPVEVENQHDPQNNTSLPASG